MSSAAPSSDNKAPKSGQPSTATTTSNNSKRGGRNRSLSRNRSLTRPERQRPKQGMLNRTPSQKTQDAGIQADMNDSTGNLIQAQGGQPPQGESGSGPLSPAAAAAAQEQHQQRLRLQQQNQQGQGGLQQPNMRPRPRRASTLRRNGSRAGSNAPQRRPSTMARAKKKLAEREIELTAWVVVSRIFTCCIPSGLLRCCNGRKFSRIEVVQAWREKVTLCMIIALICGVLAFIIFGLTPTLCPTDSRSVIAYSTTPTDGQPATKDNHIDSVIIRGSAYPFDKMQQYLSARNIIMSPDFRAMDISSLFYDSSNPCSDYPAINVTSTQCTVPNPYNNTPLVAKPCLTFQDLSTSGPKFTGKVSFLWSDVNDLTRPDLNNIMIYDGQIFNVTQFIYGNQVFGPDVASVLYNNLRKDASLPFQRTDARKKAIGCIEAMTQVGVLENTTMGCFASKIIILTTLICVCMVVGIKFLMALTFSWFLSYRLTEKPRTVRKSSQIEKEKEEMSSNGQDLARGKNAATRKNLYTVMLVTCYSEGENSIRTTLDSLANTSYSSKHKLMLVICDGIVRGHGNKLTTPDIVVNMLDLAPGNENPKASSYLAIADGEKQHNMAKVYAGHYVYKKKRCPTIVIVKCGNPLEKDATKPGNRGKRDSQLILMSFFQRVLFADRFTELDFELFHKIHQLMNVWPDRFELCLMVDADTMVKGDSLSYMVTAMQNDHTIMGLCGETKIANKTSSWVTAIQVFEYYISHHLGKAFESVFGGVTCLPGCFCMYRIKAPKNESWVPIIANPEVIQEYNQNIVSTLHQKNLLLLGEDRYLTTLMLRTFPKRQMVFVPQAQCKTVVPDTFSVLLSQRRRWINSTIHNLLELVLVTDLCGIAFLSMQFVVLLELIGTVVLPASILFTVGMIVFAIISKTLAVLPMVLIIVIIGLPAVLIVLTTRKWIYVLWMLIYLVSLPIWNFVLPLYSFWHFDDFSWGETRKVANQKRKSGQDHGDAEGVFESGSIIMRKWEEWEKERLKALGYRIQRRHSADRGINDLPPPAASTMDLNKSPKKTSSAINLNMLVGATTPVSRSTVSGSIGRQGTLPAASTPSLGSTLNSSSGSLRGPPPNGGPRHVSHQPMPQSTPNLALSPEQQQQQQQMQRHSTVGGGMRPPRPRPPPGQMSPRPPPGSMGPGQSFEMGAMTSPGTPQPSRMSYMPTTGAQGPGPRPYPAGGANLEARHSVHGAAGPGFRPVPSARPMMGRPRPGPGPGPGPGPMQRPPPPTSQSSHPFQRPPHPQQQQQQQGNWLSGPPGQGSPRPHPSMPYGGAQQPPPPQHFVNYQQQQGPPPSSAQSKSASAPIYPLPPPVTGNNQAHTSFIGLAGDRQSRSSDTSQEASSTKQVEESS
ncbi:chitin synthase [Entomortierella parvispora]|uniref:chitin synthase n=1 Tax=Entomortierella parvispora TaxID=205924 RepID=A0A9P3LRR7_9FUNG|nr:chitin synthase [Entomortierella parvispora]